MKVKLNATIPVVTYGNIMPEIEAEAETYEEALAIAESRLVKIWNRYVEAGKQLPEFGDRVELEAFVGGRVWYDRQTHTYTNERGDVYLSGSVYADSFRKPFNKEGIAAAMAKKSGVSAADIIDMWELKGKASKEFGSAVHSALQLYEAHRELAGKLSKPTHLHDNFVLKPIVEEFYALHGKEKALSEVLVVDHKTKRAGQIDRLQILGTKHGRVTDYKTGEVKDNLLIWLKQCDFYSDIMRADGWKMENPIIYNWNGKWTELNGN